ncbi:NotI family restriction endonuclease [Pelomicrobium methylotrophicum]|nr:NotI family restriction endonuclease [Pelomicrobium methylotrophicum]
MTANDRLEFAHKAKLTHKVANLECPYRTRLFGRPMMCNKNGGVCSIALYTQSTDDNLPNVSQDIVSLCPSRLLEPEVFKRIGKAILGSDEVYLVREVPFLQNAAANSQFIGAKAGRLDFVLVDNIDRKRWCAVETQSVYFSGRNMKIEFDAIISAGGELTMPVARRRPDYRSSVPKRLSPQLMLKAPYLGSGKYLAVIVDTYVRSQMAELEEVSVNCDGMNDEELRLEKLALSQIVWFVVDLRPGECAKVVNEHYTTLISSVKAVEAALPIPANRFTSQLNDLIEKASNKRKKVIKLF